MSNTDFCKILKGFVNSKKEYEHYRLYNLNIIDELHADENAHTRILLKLLSYENNGRKLFLESFIDIINEHINDPKMRIKFSGKSSIYGQFCFMDGYIKSSDGWVIIIENKINWAKDQESQIDRYIETAIDDGIDENKIYVIYLTDDGRKKVSISSFTIEGNILGYINEDETGRFIEVNYKKDILLFLKETVDKLTNSKERILSSAITQYIDYLEGRFGIRNSEKEYNTMMNESLLKIMNLDGTDEEKYEKIEEIQQELNKRLEMLKSEVYPNQPNNIANQLNDFLNQNLSKVKPFESFKLYQGTGIISRAWSIPLSSKKDKWFAVDICILPKNSFYFEFHIIKRKGEWVDSSVFNKCLLRIESLYNYFESNKEFSKNDDKNSYIKMGMFRDIFDLEKLIVNQFSVIKKYLPE